MSLHGRGDVRVIPLDGFGPRSWARPEATGFGRLPMATHLPRPDVVSLDGSWAFVLRDRPEDVTTADLVGPTEGWGAIEVPGCWTMQGSRPPAVHQHPDAVPRPPAERARCQPHGGAPPHGHPAAVVGGPAPRAARGRRRDRAVRPRRRRAAGHGQGLAAAPRVRPHGCRRARSPLRAGPHGRAVVRRHLPRGPGPLAPRRPAPQRLRVRHASGPRGRRARHRRLRPGHRRGPAAHRGVGRGRRPRAPRLDRAGRIWRAGRPRPTSASSTPPSRCPTGCCSRGVAP